MIPVGATRMWVDELTDRHEFSEIEVKIDRDGSPLPATGDSPRKNSLMPSSTETPRWGVSTKTSLRATRPGVNEISDCHGILEQNLKNDRGGSPLPATGDSPLKIIP